MPYRPIRPSLLTEAQRATKLTWDAEHKAASDAAADVFYTKKRTVGVTKAEETAFLAADLQAWDDEVARRIAGGLYEEYSQRNELIAEKASLEARIQEIDDELATLPAPGGGFLGGLRFLMNILPGINLIHRGES